MGAGAFRFLRQSSDPVSKANAAHLRGAAWSVFARHKTALSYFDRALSIDPNHTHAHYGRGVTLGRLDRHTEAISCFEHALALQPDFLDAHYAYAVSLIALKQYAEALPHLEKVTAGQPDNINARYTLGICLMALGDLPRGLEGLEYRYQMSAWWERKRKPMDLPSQPWRGEPLAGKTILVYHNEGLGDALQFSRFVPQLAEHGAKVILHAYPKLLELFRGSISAEKFITDLEAPPPHDFHCRLMRLPLNFRTSIDTMPASPYLHADRGRVADWSRRLGPRRRPRVGISWAGNKWNFPYDDERSVLLEALRPLTDLECDLISLQRPIPRCDRKALRAMPGLMRLGESLTDYADIAAVIENLDLVIAVDSSIAHLAGALGKPVWLMLAHTPDWRWLIEGTTSPWYSNHRLFRQPSPGDWAAVVADVKQACAEFLGKHGSATLTDWEVAS